MQSWADQQLEILRPMYPGWDLWAVSRLPAQKGSVWCARPKGAAVAVINVWSVEDLIKAIADYEAK